MKRWLVIALVAIVFVVAIAGAIMFRGKTTKRVKHPPNDDPWVLVSYDPKNPYGTYLGNGFISTRIMGDGVGSQDGKPLPCYMAGLYDNEKLIPAPTWSDLRFYDGGVQFWIDKSTDYRQTLNMRTGILTTYATWRAGEKTLKGKIEVMVSRTDPNVGVVTATLVSNFNGVISADTLVGKPPKGLEVVHREDGVPTQDYYFGEGYRTEHSGIHVALELVHSSGPWKFKRRGEFRACAEEVVALKGRPFRVESCASLAAGHNWAVVWSEAHGELTGFRKTEFRERHEQAWKELWSKDIIIDGPAKDQQAIHSCMFYILQSVREGSRWSIPPMGLSSDAFGGHIFWDADVWIFPALILQHPELARSIVEYRFNTLPGAMANAKADGYKGAEYAWESGYTGKEDTPRGLNYRHERHINGDVALAQWQYYLATGDKNWLKTRGFPVLKATADYWVSRVTYNSAKNRYEILKVVPPDENAEIVDNSVYTNAIAKMNLELATRAAKIVGAAPNPKWAEVAAKMYIPLDAKARRFIPFDGYRGFKAKQADTELLAYPLQFKIPGQDMTEVYRNTFRFYQPKVLPNGPAMSSSAHCVIAARLGDCAGAYKFWQESYTSYLRGPFNYFNEKRSKTWEQMCFLTGAAGPIQSTLFGLAGIQINYDDPDAPWQGYKPCLPKQWKSLTITGLQWRGSLEFPLTILPGNKVRGGAVIYNVEGPVHHVELKQPNRPGSGSGTFQTPGTRHRTR